MSRFLMKEMGSVCIRATAKSCPRSTRVILPPKTRSDFIPTHITRNVFFLPKRMLCPNLPFGMLTEACNPLFLRSSFVYSVRGSPSSFTKTTSMQLVLCGSEKTTQRGCGVTASGLIDFKEKELVFVSDVAFRLLEIGAARPGDSSGFTPFMIRHSQTSSY